MSTLSVESVVLGLLALVALLTALGLALGPLPLLRRATPAGQEAAESASAAGPARRAAPKWSSVPYLPVWVVVCMTLAVAALSWQVNSAVQSICATPYRCATAASAPGAGASAAASAPTPSAKASAEAAVAAAQGAAATNTPRR